MVEDDMVVDLLGKFTVDTFNKSCQMYVNRYEDNKVSGAEFMECKFYKLTKEYIFYKTIEAIEQGIPGVYTTKVECKTKDGARTLLNFELTDRKPKWNRPWVKPHLESKVEYETVEDGSSDPQDFYKLIGMVHRETEGGGFNYHNPPFSAHIIIYNSSKDKNAMAFEPNGPGDFKLHTSVYVMCLHHALGDRVSLFWSEKASFRGQLTNEFLFATVEGMHAVPPPLTGNYMPLGHIEIDDESVPELVVNEPKGLSQPKIWNDAHIIEEYESDSDDECVSKPSLEQEKPSFASINTAKHVKSRRESVKYHNTFIQSPKVDKRDWNGLMSKKLGLGYGFTKMGCFVCGSLSRLIRDCDFYEKRMARQAELNKKMVLTSTGRLPVNTARQNSTSPAVSTSAARKVNAVRPILNDTLKGKGIVDSGCSRHMTSNKAYLAEYQDYNGGPVAFGSSKGYITGEGKIKTGKLDFEDVYFVKELQDFNLFSVLQIYDKKKKSRDMIEFCGSKGIKREYINVRTLQQNGVAEKKNRALIKAARTMLAYSFLPNTFWAEAVSTACYVLNRVLVTKPHNKTLYELITVKILIISYIRPFGCHVTILNTIDHMGKFDGKSDEGFLVGYSLNSKAFRPITAENKANKTAGPKEANNIAGTKENIDAANSEMEAESAQEYFVLPIWSSYTSTIKSSKAKNADEKPDKDTGSESNEEPKDHVSEVFLEELERLKRQEKEADDATKILICT
ncbi:retrovirus-related pol polyprotein from transposon TNT 1-94 [Tanacetum coccineum]